MRRPTARSLAITTIAAAAVAVPAAEASAATSQERLAGFPVPDLGEIFDDVTGTTSVGGLITQTTTGIADAIDAVLADVLSGSALGEILGPTAGDGGDEGGLLPADALEALFATLGIPVLEPGRPAPGGTTEVDDRAPDVTVRFRTTKLRNTGRDGRLKLEVTSDEPGVVALRGAIRPGKARAKRYREDHSRSLIRIPSLTLGFKKAGTLKLTVKLSTEPRRTLAHSKDMRMSITTAAADASRNQQGERVKLRLER